MAHTHGVVLDRVGVDRGHRWAERLTLTVTTVAVAAAKLVGILHLTGATNITAALRHAATTSPTAPDPQDPLINDLARDPAAEAEAEICISKSISHIDSDIKIFELDPRRTRLATN